ncbi:hypothetical protein [Ruegeria sp. ANG10]|uniref:hypothetical protein n=1 Tax=Ruegeria sp. ANG10 TaxID=3042467 RepID=UPI003452334E
MFNGMQDFVTQSHKLCLTRAQPVYFLMLNDEKLVVMQQNIAFRICCRAALNQFPERQNFSRDLQLGKNPCEMADDIARPFARGNDMRLVKIDNKKLSQTKLSYLPSLARVKVSICCDRHPEICNASQLMKVYTEM